MAYVLGIDGGGTKTTGVVANTEGIAVAEATVGATNPNIVSPQQLKKEFLALAKQLKRQNGQAYHQIDRLFAGVSGTGHPTSRQKVVEVLESIFQEVPSIKVDTDAIIALYSGTKGKPGIVQISGTGSVTYGVNSQDDRARAGGWGHFAGEQGSGYGLGHDALKAAFAAHDHLGPQTALTKILPDFFQEQSMPDIIPHIYQGDNPKETVASLSRLVMKAADEGDQVAKDIIKKHGHAIGQSIAVLINRLFIDHASRQTFVNTRMTAIPIVLAGGLFHRLDLFREAIEEELSQQPLPFKLIKPEAAPVSGAVAAALSE